MADKRVARRDMLSPRLLGDLINTVEQTVRELRRSVVQAAPPPPSPPSLPVLHRPPCAIEELAFVGRCTRCDACVRACPAGAIMHAEPIFGKAAGTPVIDPTKAACTMCDERACVTVCQAEGSGVLTPLLAPRMGTARIHPSRCMVYLGDQCDACFETCPVEGALTGRGHHPSVDAAACVGCGMCVQACPTEPGAVSIIATRGRPPMPEP